MKKIIGLSLFLFFGLSSTMVQAQSTAKKVEHDVKKGAKKAGNKTAELASKGESRVKDKVYKDKTGPDGQTVYITDDSRYYWVDKKGHRQYITETEMRPKQ